MKERDFRNGTLLTNIPNK